jgi:hypothetical protein
MTACEYHLYHRPMHLRDWKPQPEATDAGKQ